MMLAWALAPSASRCPAAGTRRVGRPFSGTSSPATTSVRVGCQQEEGPMWARMLLCATASAMLSLAAFAQTETVASQIVTELWTPKTAIQILAGSAVITALINTIWFAVTAGLQRLQQWWNAKSTVYPVVFSRGM